MIHVQEAVKEDTSAKKMSLPEIWWSSRFNDLHMLLSGENRLAYITLHYLTMRPPEPKFILRLKNLETPWDELFSKVFPWDFAYSAFALHSCVQLYKNDDPTVEWLRSFGDKHHSHLVDLLDWLSKLEIGAGDWNYSISYIVAIVDRFLSLGILHPFSS